VNSAFTTKARNLPECRWRRSQTHDEPEPPRTDQCHRYAAPPAVRICRQSPP